MSPDPAMPDSHMESDAMAVTAPTAPADAPAAPEAPATPGALAAHAAPDATVAPPAVVPRRNARAGLAKALRRLLRTGVAVAFFAVGAYFGWQSFLSNQPVTEIVADPAVAGVPTPEIVQELANAIGSNDADAIRAALDPTIFSAYTADIQSFGIMSVDGVDTLGTYEDGARSATALVIHGRDADKNPFSVNLIVLVENGQIVRLR